MKNYEENNTYEENYEKNKTRIIVIKVPVKNPCTLTKRTVTFLH